MLIIVVLALVAGFSNAVAQGNQGALTVERQYRARIAALARADTAYEHSLAVYDTTGQRPKGMTSFDGDVFGEANLALIGGSSVKPALMATAEYKKHDYLSFGAQFLFGDTGGEQTQQDIGNELFVPEASKYALNLLGIWKPKSQGAVSKEFAVNFGFYYAQKELPGDSLDTGRDTGVIHGHVGVEYILMTGEFSIYANVHYLANHQNVAEYQAYFGPGARDEFVYFAPGIRAKFSDHLFVDLELICLTDEMNSLYESDDGILPLFRIGFMQGLTDFGLN
jgi:hypothetical protein